MAIFKCPIASSGSRATRHGQAALQPVRVYVARRQHSLLLRLPPLFLLLCAPCAELLRYVVHRVQHCPVVARPPGVEPRRINALAIDPQHGIAQARHVRPRLGPPD